MNFAQSGDILKRLKKVIHAETQQHEHHVDLTVNYVYQFRAAGSLDFGGSEFEQAEIQKLKPAKESPGDDYGWWKLQEGTYRVEFNEIADIGHQGHALIFPHDHAIKAGLNLVSNIIHEADSCTLTTNIQVPSVSCKIKENARLASLYLLE